MQLKVLVAALLMSSALSMASSWAADTAPTPQPTTATASASALALSDEEIRAVLTQMVDKVIVPTYQQMVSDSAKLAETSTNFCTTPSSETLQNLRAAWSQALSTWQTADAFLYGPVVENELDFRMYFRPIKKPQLQSLLSGTEPISAESLHKLGMGVQGFAGLEYVLFERETKDEAILKRIQDTAQSCHYLKAASTLIHTQSQDIAKQWQTHYAEALKTAGNGSTEFVSAPEAFILVINRLYQAAEDAKLKLQTPIGQPAYQAGLDPKREQVNAHQLEAWRSGHTFANIQATLKGFELILTEGGLIDWLKANDQTLIASEMLDILSQIKAVTLPSTDLFAQLEAKDLAAADELFLKLQLLTRTFKLKFASTLNVPLGFNSNDGD